MINSHPKEKEIQEYAINPSACSPEIMEHIESCAHCREEMMSYQFLYTGFKQQPRPVFDFDVAALVLPQLASREPLLSADRFIAGFLVVFICSCVGIPVFLFHQYILNMFSGISPFFIYIILGSATVIVLIKTLDLYKKYKNQMSLLNFN